MVSDRTLRFVLRSESRVALLGDLIRAITAVTAVGVVVWYLAYYAALGRTVFVELHMNDFGKFYYSARAFWEGADMYEPTPATAMPVGQGRTLEFANMNPPHFHLLVLPIARLQPLPAMIAWTLLSAIGLAGSLRLVARELGIQWTASRMLLALVGILVCSATEATILTGQVTFVLLLPLTVAWVAARRQRWIASAVWLGVLASLKPFLGIFGIYFIVRRHVAAALAMVAMALACFLLGLLVFGWSAYRSWLDALGGIRWTWAVMNASLHAPLARVLSDNPFFAPLMAAPEAVTPIGVLLGLVATVIAFVVIARDDSPDAIDRATALLILTALLASPLGWIYYLWFAVGPLAALWVSGSLSRWPRPGVFVLIATPGLLCPIGLTLFAQHWRWGGLTMGSIYTWTTLTLWVAVVLSAKGPHSIARQNGRSASTGETGAPAQLGRKHPEAATLSARY
jgi:hypothetical protein